MNREIKFRTWNVPASKMKYNPTLPIGFLNDIFESTGSMYMQFTGLKDKNGKEIYEGDIVHCEDEMYSSEKVWRTDESKAITFENGGFRFDGLVLGDMIGSDPLTFEVIGNIYENPELVAPTK